MTTEYTVDDFLDAVEKNNYPQGKTLLFFIPYDETDTLYACAAGQGLLNLGVFTPDQVKERITSTRLHTYIRGKQGYYSDSLENEGINVISEIDPHLYERIYHLNDSNGYSCKEVAEKVREKYKEVSRSLL